jgi:hypothetical protein
MTISTFWHSLSYSISSVHVHAFSLSIKTPTSCCHEKWVDLTW